MNIRHKSTSVKEKTFFGPDKAHTFNKCCGLPACITYKEGVCYATCIGDCKRTVGPVPTKSQLLRLWNSKECK